jgi:hypothetical protein
MSPGERYGELCKTLLALPDVTMGRALSNEGLMVHGKLFGFLRGDSLVVKLPRDRIDSLLGVGSVTRALMGRRTMKEWVELAEDADWPALAAESHEYVRSLYVRGLAR